MIWRTGSAEGAAPYHFGAPPGPLVRTRSHLHAHTGLDAAGLSEVALVDGEREMIATVEVGEGFAPRHLAESRGQWQCEISIADPGSDPLGSCGKALRMCERSMLVQTFP